MASGSLNQRIALQRMISQHIDGVRLDNPHDTVKAMGFVQAQDYLGSLWAVGLRTTDATEDRIEQALAEGSIVRTWPSRNTLGYVAAEDVRWMLDLLAPRAVAARKGRYRQLNLSEEDFKKSARLITDALSRKGRLTRAEVYRLLENGGVPPTDQRGIHILSHLALQKLICFGPREGKQQTFVLLDDWLAEVKSIPHTEALGRLALRFFSGHGPATARDFAWWSGLTLAEVKEGLYTAGSQLEQETVEDKTFWMPANAPQPKPARSAVLLPGFDEYLVGYTDRSAVLDPELSRRFNLNGGMLNPIIVIDGFVRGTWKRTLKINSVEVIANWFEHPSYEESQRLISAAQRYGQFLGLKARIG